MAFITRLSENSLKKPLRVLFAAAAIVLLLFKPSEAAAEGIAPTRSSAVLTATGQLDVSSRSTPSCPTRSNRL